MMSSSNLSLQEKFRKIEKMIDAYAAQPKGSALFQTLAEKIVDVLDVQYPQEEYTDLLTIAYNNLSLGLAEKESGRLDRTKSMVRTALTNRMSWTSEIS